MKRTIKIGALAAATAVLATGCLVPFDFDGNGKADLAYIDLDGSWHRVGEEDPFFSSADPSAFSVAVPGDYDGNGKWEAANLLSGGRWETGGARGTVVFAHAGTEDFVFGDYWLPVPGNYDADRATEMAWYHQSDATWHIEGQDPIQFGVGSDTDMAYFHVPVPADYDGDGVDDLATYDPGDGSFMVRDVGVVATLFPGGFPTAADFDGDGDDDPAVAGFSPVDVSSDDPWDWVWEPAFSIAGQPNGAWEDGALPAPGNFNAGPGDEIAGFTWMTTFDVEGQAPVDMGTPLGDGIYPATMRPWLPPEILRLTFIGNCYQVDEQVVPHGTGLSC